MARKKCVAVLGWARPSPKRCPNWALDGLPYCREHLPEHIRKEHDVEMDTSEERGVLPVWWPVEDKANYQIWLLVCAMQELL